MRSLIWGLVLSVLLGSPASAETVNGMVQAVFDGDTVLLVSNSGRMKVRLYGVDAPETAKKGQRGQPFGGQSKRVLMYKVMGRVVTADIQEKDQYGRAVAVVKLSGRDINAEMVSEGMAWAYRRYLSGPYASEYIGLEERARKQHRGLWRDGNPRPPWEFRKQSR